VTLARDPAVVAVYALHLTAKELAEAEAGRPIRRPYWPPQRCQGVVVGLCAGADRHADRPADLTRGARPAKIAG